MNPQAPDPLEILLHGRDLPGRRDQRINDDLKIVDPRRAVGGWSSDADFKASISKNFDFSGASGLEQGIKKAEKDNVPLVLVVTSKDSKDGKQLVDNVIPATKNGAHKAIYVQVTKEELAANPDLAKAAGQIGTNNTAFTGIFMPKNGQLGDVMCNTWGARAEIPSILKDQLGSAQFTMDSRKALNVEDGKPDIRKDKGTEDGKPKERSRLDNPFAPKEPDLKEDGKEVSKEVVEQRKKEDAAEEKVTPLVRSLVDAMKELGKNPTPARREELYTAAEKAADEIAKNPDDLKLFQTKAKRQLQERVAKGDKGADADREIKDLQARVSLLDMVSTSDSWTRLQHGLSQMQSGDAEKGIAKIKEGAEKNKAADPLNNPEFVKQLLEIPMGKQNLDELKKKFPEIKFDDYFKNKGAEGREEGKNEKPDDAKTRREQQALFARLIAAPQSIMDPLKGLTQESNPKDVDEAYKKAIEKASDKNLKEDIKKATQILESRKQELTKSQADDNTRKELDQIDKDLATVKRIDQLDGYLAISSGAFKLKTDKANPSAGVEDVKKGLALHPELAKNEAVIAKLKDTGYDTTKLKEWFPSLAITDGAAPPSDKGSGGKEKEQAFEQAMKRLAEQHKGNIAPLNSLGQNPSPDAVLKAFDEAIANARKVKPEDVSLADSTLKEKKEAIKKRAGDQPLSKDDQDEIASIDRELKSVKNIGQAEGMLLVSKGVFELAADKSKPEAGLKDIKEGFRKFPELAQEKDVRDRLLASGVDAKVLRDALPELGPDFGVKPGEGEKPPEKPKKPEKIAFEGNEFDKASDVAIDSKRKMALKFGTPQCSDCKWMSNNSWPDKDVQKTLDENYVFVDIDGLKEPKIREQFQANEWPAVLVVEPYKDAEGKTQYKVVDKMKIESREDHSDINAEALNRFLTDALKKKAEAK